MTKRKISFEQNEALAYGRTVARRNQRARVAANAADAKIAAEREAQRAAEAARELEQRAGFELGARVTGTDRIFDKTRVGTVIEGPRSERGTGVWIVTDEGHEWLLGKYSVKGL